jgi:septal ring-binding cell division protein DamX
MATESGGIARVFGALGVALVAGAFGSGASRAAGEQPPPDVKRICVPAADGRNWECGTADNPPAPRELPPPESRPSTASPPPFFLANPDAQQEAPIAEEPASVEAPRTDDFPEIERVTPGAESATADATTDATTEDGPEVNAVSDSPAVEPTPVDDAPAEATADAMPTETTPSEFAASETETSEAPEAIDATTSDPAPTDTVADTSAPVPEPPAPIDQVTDAAPTEPAPEPVAISEAAPVETTLESGREPLDSSAFRALDPKHQTVQLARAASRDGFAAYAWTLGLAPESTFAVPYNLNGTTVWLLLWSDFPDFASARAAADALARDHQASGIYVRRIGPLQRELDAHGG